MTTSRTTTSRLKVHMGSVLWQLANTYHSLPLTLVEGVQNGIDAEADRILVAVDLKSRTVWVTDNGVGVSEQGFNEALESVGKGVKAKDKLGRFGLGLIAPLNKCQRFTFCSKPEGSRALMWTFIGSVIRAEHNTPEIPIQDLPRVPMLPPWLLAHITDEFVVEWRTQVKLLGVTQDKVISLVDLDEFEAQVRQKLGQAMRRSKTRVRVVLRDVDGRVQRRDINPIEYTGEPLPNVEYPDKVAGRVTFELYRATKHAGRRSGQVGVSEMGSDYPISMAEFIRQARNSEWYEIAEPALTVLKSGYFEGVILCEGIELHPERTRFQPGEPLRALYLVLATWYDEYGKVFFEDEQGASREARYQDLGLKSQQRLRDILLSQPQYQRLWDALRQSVTFGRLGDGHLEPDKGKPNGFENDPSVRTGQGGAGVSRGKSSDGGSSGGGSERQRPPKDRPGDTPTGVTGPRGQRRQLVRGDSQGLWYEYSWHEGSSRLWEFDFERGVLSFNVRHPIWVRLDETKGKHNQTNARWIMMLQEWLTLEVLTLLTRYQTPDTLADGRSILDTKIGPYVDLFITPAHR